MNEPVAKPYLYAEELAKLTPWTVEAINDKVKRGELRRGVHYFQETARGRRIYKWASIIELIEMGAVSDARSTVEKRSKPAEVISIEEATKRLRRMHG